MKTASRRLGFVPLAIVGTLIWAPSAGAVPVTLSDGNSTFSVNPDSQAGAYSWVVDGQNMLFQQWFWYRIGSTGGEQSIDTISAPNVSTFLGTRGVEITYRDGQLSVDTTYILTGGSPGSIRSDLAEIIVIRNSSHEDSIDLHFFQYSDFDLCGAAGDTVNIVNGNLVRQHDGTCSLNESVLAPGASRWEAGPFPSIRNKLNSGGPTNLNFHDAFGPGDATWAYQWDVTLGPNQTFLISKDKSIQPIPEPATLTLVGVGAGLLGLSLRRRKA